MLTVVLRLLSIASGLKSMKHGIAESSEYLKLTLNNPAKSDRPVDIISEYNTVTHDQKILDIWMFTNSTQVNLNYSLERIGQTKTIE